MSDKNESLASLFGKMLVNINSGNINKKELEKDKSKFQERLTAIGGSSKSPAKPKAALTKKVKKKPIVKTAFAQKPKTVKPKPTPKPKESLWDRVKRQRKEKGDRAAEKIKKQREAREGKPKDQESQTEKDPKKVRSKKPPRFR
jgi:hypothetical protein